MRAWAAGAVMVVALAGSASAGESVRFPIVDTGQTACYSAGQGAGAIACPAPGEALYGQDGNFRHHPPHYRDNGDGTVTDLVTGLMWQRGALRGVAFSQAAELAARTDTGGHRDWRVPTIKELYSLIDFRGSTGTGRPDMDRAPADARPFIDTGVFAFEYPTDPAAVQATGMRLRFIDAQYISSTVYGGTTMGGNRTFFGVNFADGRIKGYPADRGPRGWYLKLVRGPTDYGRNEFADKGDGTVADRATGLTWMQADSGDAAFRPLWSATRMGDGRMDWPEALAFCHALPLAGGGWRLPSAKELQGLVDYSRSPQATRSAALDPVFRATRIIDEAGKADWPAYWTATTHLDGPVPAAGAVIVHFGEALGAPQFGMGGGPMGGPPGGGRGMGGPGMGRGPMGGGQPPASAIIDVHGAGAQRSDPKVATLGETFPQWGRGPQGDVRRVYNHVRCVR